MYTNIRAIKSVFQLASRVEGLNCCTCFNGTICSIYNWWQNVSCFVCLPVAAVLRGSGQWGCEHAEQTISEQCTDCLSVYLLVILSNFSRQIQFQSVVHWHKCICLWERWSFSLPFPNIRSVVRKTADDYTKWRGSQRNNTHIDKWRKTKPEPCAVYFCSLFFFAINM